MSNIPKVLFRKRTQETLEFEVFTLQNLFSRRQIIKDHSPTAPHRLQFYIIMYITKGFGSHFIDLKPYQYRKGTMLFIAKGQIHAFQVYSENDGYLIMFTERFLQKNLIHSDILSLDRLFNYHLYLPIIQPEELKTQNMDQMVRSIDAEYQMLHDFGKEEILRSLLKVLLLKVERIKESVLIGNKNSEWLNIFTTFKSHLEAHFSETRNAGDFADMLHISYKHLNEICKSITGKTAKEFIDKHLILEMKRQLACSDISVKELTYKMGFDEPTNMVKFFKKHAHETPSQFKKTLAQ